GFAYVVNEDLAIADFAGPRRASEGLDHFLRSIGRDDHLDLDLRQEVHLILLTAIHLFVPLLAAMAPNFADRHSIDADSLQGFFHFVEFKRLDNGFNLLHLGVSPYDSNI